MYTKDMNSVGTDKKVTKWRIKRWQVGQVLLYLNSYSALRSQYKNLQVNGDIETLDEKRHKLWGIHCGETVPCVKWCGD